MAVELNATLAQHIEVSPGLAILRVVPDGWEPAEFQPGQFGVLALPGSAIRCVTSEPDEEPVEPERLIKRAYSIASSSVMREFLEFYVVLVPSGALTPRLFALNRGDRLWLSPKFSGMFTLAEVPADQHIVLVSTGTGLAPYMSMLRSTLVCGGTRRMAVLHGARHSWDLGYRSELMTLKRMCSNFTYLPIVSRPGDESSRWAGESGYVQDLWTRGTLAESWGFEPTPADTHVFLCGNPAMVETLLLTLTAEGFTRHTKQQPGQIHVETYW
ncbi:MAG: ferredoxin--NADP reductase [Candidatus Delongbacteria bacterium]